LGGLQCIHVSSTRMIIRGRNDREGHRQGQSKTEGMTSHLKSIRKGKRRGLGTKSTSSSEPSDLGNHPLVPARDSLF
jgi:hypothetical protein